jgi:hypothetical protein
MEQHVDPAREQFDAFKALPRDAPVAMLNLVRFREEAAYPADHPLATAGLSGAAAYGHYGAESGPIFRRVGGRILWSGLPQVVLIGPADELWNAAFVAFFIRLPRHFWRWSSIPSIGWQWCTGRQRWQRPG